MNSSPLIESFPDFIQDVEHLEDLLSEPTPGVIDTVCKLDGDFIVLGVGGKMGPSLARMIRRALDAAGSQRRVIGVSRFGNGELPDQLHSHGIEPVSCDLLNDDTLNALPDVSNVIYMAGMKFGSTGQQARTWAMNTFLPGRVAQKFRASRIVAFSTGNVYSMVPVDSGGCTEEHEPAPNGEYAMSCLGRERILEHFSRTLNIQMAIIRLNYAVEMRYGVLLDIATRVWNNQPVDVSMAHLNAIWQADANAMAIQSFAHLASPPFVLNVTGPEILSVRAVAEDFGRLMGRQPAFSGTTAATALLNNAQRGIDLYGAPRVSTRQVLKWTADWVMRGGPTLNKPTHFESRDGKF